MTNKHDKDAKRTKENEHDKIIKQQSNGTETETKINIKNTKTNKILKNKLSRKTTQSQWEGVFADCL